MRIFVKNKKDKMRSTAEYITILRDYMTKNASKYSITRMGIFGSVARGEQTEDSDVDVYLETSQPNMFALVHIKKIYNLYSVVMSILSDCVITWILF